MYKELIINAIRDIKMNIAVSIALLLILIGEIYLYNMPDTIKYTSLVVFMISIMYLFVRISFHIFENKKGEYLDIEIDEVKYGVMQDGKPIESSSEDVTKKAKTYIKKTNGHKTLKFKVDNPYLLEEGKTKDKAVGVDKDAFVKITLTKIFKNKKWVKF